MRFRIPAVAAAFLAVSAFAMPASAATVVKAFEFTANTPGALTPQHAGSFRFSFDDVSLAATLEAVDFAIGSTTFTTANTGIRSATIGPFVVFELGGLANGIDGLNAATNDFYLLFDLALGNPFFDHTQTGFAGRVLATGENGRLAMREVTVAAAAVPEPGAWALMILGFGGAGAMLRRKGGRLTRGWLRSGSPA
ncbi:PEPxxWA-CTERM sorting domain-containing protein [Phenylobacterium kunshanense]|nr:PEPxxWA-CTERM sorting domain-containing protein [Phenylobacterium kunshanense]